MGRCYEVLAIYGEADMGNIKIISLSDYMRDLIHKNSSKIHWLLFILIEMVEIKVTKMTKKNFYTYGVQVHC